jgi:hypothetical protein
VLRDALERFGGLEQPSATIAARASLGARRGHRGGVRGRDRVAHPRQPPRRRRRPGRPVRGAQPPGHRGGRPAARDGRDRPRARSLSAPAGGSISCSPPTGGCASCRAPRRRAGRAGSPRRGAGPRRGAPRPRAEDAAAREIITEEVDGRSFRWTPAGSGRCTASPRTP